MLGRQRPFSPSVPAEAGCLFTAAAGVHVFISGESLHCFLVGWCTNKSYVIATSDLWLFIHASNLLPSTPHTTPLQKLALASRIGSRRVAHRPGDSVEELSGGTGRQCRGAVWRHWDSVAELSGTEAVRWGPDHRASPTLMADLQQLQQQDPVLRPVLAAWTAKLSDTMERSTLALVQQYSRRFLKNGILRCGQADQRRGTLQQLILPSSLRPDVPREVRNYICERCTVVPFFRKKEGDMMLGMVVR